MHLRRENTKTVLQGGTVRDSMSSAQCSGRSLSNEEALRRLTMRRSREAMQCAELIAACEAKESERLIESHDDGCGCKQPARQQHGSRFVGDSEGEAFVHAAELQNPCQQNKGRSQRSSS